MLRHWFLNHLLIVIITCFLFTKISSLDLEEIIYSYYIYLNRFLQLVIGSVLFNRLFSKGIWRASTGRWTESYWYILLNRKTSKSTVRTQILRLPQIRITAVYVVSWMLFRNTSVRGYSSTRPRAVIHTQHAVRWLTLKITHDQWSSAAWFAYSSRLESCSRETRQAENLLSIFQADRYGLFWRAIIKLHATPSSESTLIPLRSSGHPR